MRVDVISLFPEFVAGCAGFGVVGRAIERELLSVHGWNPRDYAEGNYRRVDDRPFGGGPGMVMMIDPLRTARTGRALQVSSDARYRFERGVDPAFVGPATALATRMILELCGGEASHISRAGKMPDWHRKLPYRPARAAARRALSTRKLAT